MQGTTGGGAAGAGGGGKKAPGGGGGAAARGLGDMIDPAGSAASNHSTFTSNIELRSHLKEILRGEYTTDRPFETGVFRDTFGAMDIRGELGRSRFVGATNDKFVLGIIKLE